MTLLDKDGAELAKLVVGKEAESKGNAATSGQIYVRKAGEPQSWLVSGRLDAAREAAGLAAEGDPRRSRRTGSARPRSASPTARRCSSTGPAAENKDFTLHDVPDGKELTYPTVANTMATGARVREPRGRRARRRRRLRDRHGTDRALRDLRRAGRDGHDEGPGREVLRALRRPATRRPWSPEGPVPPEGDAPKSAEEDARGGPEGGRGPERATVEVGLRDLVLQPLAVRQEEERDGQGHPRRRRARPRLREARKAISRW